MNETEIGIEDLAERCDCTAGWRPKPGHTAAEVLAAIRARSDASPRSADLARRVEAAKAGQAAARAAKGGA